MHERQRESAHAGLARRKEAGELHEEPARREKERLCMRDLCGELEPRVESLGRCEECVRLGRTAECLVELIEEPLPAALGEPGARQRKQLADRRHADAAQERLVAADYGNRDIVERKTTAPGAPER